MSNPEQITRQQLLQQYQMSPESAPVQVQGFVSAQAAKDYRFEREMERFRSHMAGGLVAEATHDADIVKQGYSGPMTKGIVAMCAGFLSFIFTPAFPLIFLVAIGCFYYGTTWLRQSTDKLRQSNYDTRFASDVVRYAQQAAQAGG